MGVVGDMLLWVTEFATGVMTSTGYAGLLLLMAAESMIFPVPSEAVMPFAGYLVHEGRFSWTGAILASSAGSALGSYLSYLLGKHGLLPMVERYGKYVFVQPHHIHKAQDYFARRGAVAVFLCRFIPGVRHVSSVPAGAVRMPLVPFMVASVAGATIWNVILLVAGYQFAGNEAAVAALKSNLDLVGVGLLVLIVAYIVYEVRAAKRGGGAKPSEAKDQP